MLKHDRSEQYLVLLTNSDYQNYFCHKYKIESKYLRCLSGSSISRILSFNSLLLRSRSSWAFSALAAWMLFQKASWTLLLFFSALFLASLDNLNLFTLSMKYKTKSIKGFIVSTESSIDFFSFNPEMLNVKMRTFLPSGSSAGAWSSEALGPVYWSLKWIESMASGNLLS